ncbi:Hypothetical Protein OBI_RACECAR_42 [Arthrobacter phage Racecar]|nr:hypothetical protein PBI_RACECAR_123 [Arthrobacter phage Racecar]QFG12798.1 hypothetical protein PBI_MIMI_120 [Arthrobacter phage Mimi]
MKVFYTPVINGEYDFRAQRRMKDRTDNEAYAIVQKVCGDAGVDRLDEFGSVKVFDIDPDGETRGYWTYQQDDL